MQVISSPHERYRPSELDLLLLSSFPAMSPLPETLAVVPLENKVLLPAVVLKITMRGREASTLTRRFFRPADQRKGAHLACIPLKQLPSDDPSATLTEEKSVIVPSKDKISASTEEQEELESGLVRKEDVKRLYEYGCAARILRVQRSGLGVVSVFIEGIARFRVDRIVQDSSTVLAKVKYIEQPTREIKTDDMKDEAIAFKALCRKFLTKMRDLQMPDTLVQQLGKLVDNVSPIVLADMLVSVIETSFDEKLWMLSTTDVKERLTKMSEWMTRQLHVSRRQIAYNSYSRWQNIKSIIRCSRFRSRSIPALKAN